MIIGFVGKMGSGKTLCMTMLAYSYFKRGCEIYANYGLLFDHKPVEYEKIKSLSVEFQNAFLAIDEIHTFIDARASMKSVNKFTSYFITQSRKRQLVFAYTTQRWGQVDVRLRNNTDYIWKCKSRKCGDNVQISVEMYDYDMKMKKMSFIANPFFKLYDTRQIVNPFKEEGE